MVYLICAPVNLISQCDVTWNVCEYARMIVVLVCLFRIYVCIFFYLSLIGVGDN